MRVGKQSAGHRRRGPGFLAALCLCACGSLGFAVARGDPAAIPEPGLLTVAIPGQTLKSALDSLAAGTGLQVVYLAGVVTEQQTRGAPAGLEATDALARLLEGTGLRSELLNPRIARILPGTPATEPEAAGTLEEILVLAHRIPKPYVAPPSAKEQRALDVANADLETRIAHQHLLYGNAALDRYVQGVAERLLAVDAPPDAVVRVRVIRGVDANAFALSNGSIYVTTALLAVLDDESQLAAVLGHELTHYTNSHTLLALRDENRSAAIAYTTGIVIDVVLGLVAAHAAPGYSSQPVISPQTMEIWVRASISGYSRDLERQADDGGIRRMIAAGYDSTGAIAALEHLAEETPATQAAGTPMYATHPRVEERIASYRDLLAGELRGSAGVGDTRRDEYRAQLGELPLDQVELLLEARDLDRAERQIAPAIARADTGRGEFLAGEIARKRIPQTDATRAQALAAYQRAMTLSGAPPAVYRQAGLLQRARGETAAAVLSFQGYLERAPGAVDAPLVRIYLEELGNPAPAPEARP